MSASQVKMSGCIVTYNNESIIEACVSSVLNWTENLDFVLYISDNGSTDRTLELIRSKFPQVVIIENKKNLGFGGGHNKVLKHLDSKYHFVINPDILVQQDVFSKLTEYLEQHKDVAMVTPKIMNENGTEQHLPKKNPTIRYTVVSKFGPFKHYRKEYTREEEDLREPTDIEFCTGCFFAIRTFVFKQLKGFDKRYFMYMEDADLSRTVHQKYRIIFFPKVYVYHKWQRENLKKIKGVMRWIRSMIQYFMKWGWVF